MHYLPLATYKSCLELNTSTQNVACVVHSFDLHMCHHFMLGKLAAPQSEGTSLRNIREAEAFIGGNNLRGCRYKGFDIGA